MAGEKAIGYYECRDCGQEFTVNGYYQSVGVGTELEDEEFVALDSEDCPYCKSQRTRLYGHKYTYGPKPDKNRYKNCIGLPDDTYNDVITLCHIEGWDMLEAVNEVLRDWTKDIVGMHHPELTWGYRPDGTYGIVKREEED